MGKYKKKYAYKKYNYQPYSSKCIFCHKDPNMKGYYKCEITGQIRGYKCNNNECKHGRADTPTTLMNWFHKIFR